MPPPTSPAKLHGAALIAPTYHITVEALDSSRSSLFSTHIRAINNATEVPPARAHRSFSTALNDWKYENLEWNSDPNRGLNLRPRMKCEAEREEDREDKEHVRIILNLARKNNERIPDKREALAMARMQRIARIAVSTMRREEHFKIMDKKEFLIISSKSERTVEASLFADSKGKLEFITKRSGNDHWEAVSRLAGAVAECKRQQREAQYLSSYY